MKGWQFITFYMICLAMVVMLAYESSTLVDMHKTLVEQKLEIMELNAQIDSLQETVMELDGMFRTSAVSTMIVTAYTHTGNLTASGTETSRGGVAVDTDVIPFGTKMYIPGYGIGTAVDTGPAIQGNRLDVLLDTESECWQWGKQKLNVLILGGNENGNS